MPLALGKQCALQLDVSSLIDWRCKRWLEARTLISSGRHRADVAMETPGFHSGANRMLTHEIAMAIEKETLFILNFKADYSAIVY